MNLVLVSDFTSTTNEVRALRVGARFALAALVTCALLAGLVANAEQGTWPPLEVAGRSVAPGETARIFFDVARTLGGKSRMLDTLVVVTRATRPGPTLCLTAAVHGDELNGVEIATESTRGRPAPRSRAR